MLLLPALVEHLFHVETRLTVSAGRDKPVKDVKQVVFPATSPDQEVQRDDVSVCVKDLIQKRTTALPTGHSRKHTNLHTIYLYTYITFSINYL